MSETQLNNGSQDEAQSMPNCTDGKSGNSLINKINAIKRKAKKDIADLKDAQVPLRKELRAKIYEINRRIKVLNIAIEQKPIEIAELKNRPTDSVVPTKYAIKIKKLDSKNHAALIKVYEEIIIEYNKAIEELDRLYEEKVSLINTKANKQIETERINNIQRKKNQAAKAKAKAQAATKAKREARQKAKEEERESGLAVLRQHLPIHQSAPITDLSGLPKELSVFFHVLDQRFKIVNDADLVSKLVAAKTANKYLSVIRQTMIDAIGGVPPAELLLVSFEEVLDGVFDFTLHVIKNRRIEHLATQYGFVKIPQSVNLTLRVNLNDEHKEAVLKDLDMFFADLNQIGFCSYIFDAQHNALFKAV